MIKNSEVLMRKMFVLSRHREGFIIGNSMVVVFGLYMFVKYFGVIGPNMPLTTFPGL